MNRLTQDLVLALTIVAVACGGDSFDVADQTNTDAGAAGDPVFETGGAAITSSGGAAGVIQETGGTVPTGGADPTGGALTGGLPATGGADPTGGAMTGGLPATGGADPTGGAMTGGLPATGGAASTGITCADQICEEGISCCSPWSTSREPFCMLNPDGTSVPDEVCGLDGFARGVLAACTSPNDCEQDCCVTFILFVTNNKPYTSECGSCSDGVNGIVHACETDADCGTGRHCKQRNDVFFKTCTV